MPAPVPATRLQLSVHGAVSEPEYRWVGLAARAVGTIVHIELQRLAQAAQLPLSPDTAAEDYHGNIVLGVC